MLVARAFLLPVTRNRSDLKGSIMNWLPKANYTKEFRESAVKLAHEVSSGVAARRLSISIKTLANWVRAAKAGGLTKVVAAHSAR